MSTKSKAEKISDVKKFLKNKYSLRYNTVKNEYEIKNKEDSKYQALNDKKMYSIKLEASKSKIDLTLLEMYLRSNEIPHYNPFREYCESLTKWDEKTSYIDQLSKTLKSHDDKFLKWSFSRWIIAMIASILEDEVINHQLPILSGKQGIGKSTWIRKLIPKSLEDYFFSGTINVSNKDTAILMGSCMLIDLDELNNLNKREAGKLKELITKQSLKLRLPYGRTVESFPRRVSFIGTLNDAEFLFDLTGTRRFLCYDISQIEDHNIDMDKVYSEAYFKFKRGDTFWFDNEDILRIEGNNNRFVIISPIENDIRKHFEVVPIDKAANNAPEYLNSTEIYQRLYDGKNPTHSDVQKVGKIMNKLGFIRVKKDGYYRYAVSDRYASYNDI